MARGQSGALAGQSGQAAAAAAELLLMLSEAAAERGFQGNRC